MPWVITSNDREASEGESNAGYYAHLHPEEPHREEDDNVEGNMNTK